MTKDAYLTYLALGLGLMSQSAKAQSVRYIWSHVPDADYYQGTLTLGQEATSFRTSSTWILVPEGSVLEVKPYTLEGQVLPEAVIAPRKEVLLQEQSPPPAKPKEAPPPAKPKEAPTPPKKTIKKAAKVRRKVVPKAVHTESSAPTRLHSSLGLRLGIGRDRLTSSGGLYGYSGESNIAPLSVGGLWVVAPMQDWGINADLSLHSFVVSNQVDAIEGGDGSVKKDRFTRLHGWLGGTVRVVGTEGGDWPQTLDLSLGFSYVQLPILRVSDTSTGQASLVNAKSTRIGLQGAYVWAATPEVSLGLNARYAPFSLDLSTPSDGYGIHVYCGYKVAHGQMLDIGVDSSADEISSKSSCNDGVDCPTKATSTSRVTDLRVGYRLGF